ncbi:MAG: hypothetical protein ACERLB_14370 [Gammaproteobacteria bacterium]
MLKTKCYLVLLMTSCLIFGQACSLVTPTVDVEEIAGITGELIAEVEHGLEFDNVILLIRYIDDEEIASVSEWQKTWNELLAALRAVARYSIVVIEIAGNQEAEGFQAELGENVSELYADLRAVPSLRSSLETVNLDSILTNVQSEDKFLEAARATLPAISAVVSGLNTLANKNAKNLDKAVDDFITRIDANHSEVIKYQDRIIERRNTILVQLQLLDLAREGDSSAWNELRMSGMQMKAELKKFNTPDQTGIDRAETVIIRNLATLDTIRDSLQPDFDLYTAELLELRSVSRSIDQALVVGRLSIGAWAHGHQLFIDGKKTGFALFSAALLKYTVSKSATGLFRRY